MNTVRDLRGKVVQTGDLVAVVANRNKNPELVIGEVKEITTAKSKSSSYGFGKTTTLIKVEGITNSEKGKKFTVALEAQLRRIVKLS